jgi:hypothetical protein
MYEYKFVKVEVSNFSFKAKLKDDYHEIIYQHAKEGWKLFQIFAPPMYGQGTAAFFDIIFEREQNK